MNCNTCGRVATTKPDKRGTERIPNGWKRFNKSLWCNTCWTQGFVLRAITFPVASPIGIEWAQLRERLSNAWAQSTECANTVITELAKADAVRSPAMEKLTAAPKLNVYAIVRTRRPDMDSTSAASLARHAQQKYNAARYDVIWRGSATLPYFRYPVPFPVPGKSWSAEWLSAEEHAPVVSVRLGGERIKLRLRSGPGFSRQLASFRQLVDCEALHGELAFYRKRVASNNHRPGLKDHDGTASVKHDIMVKLVAWLPVTCKKAEQEKIMELERTDDAFWVAQIANHEPWRLHADHVHRWIAEHTRRLARLADDQKYEQRTGEPPRLQDFRSRIVVKHGHRIRTWMQQAASAVAKYAARKRVTRIVYNDSKGTYLPSFPWYELGLMLENKLHEYKISFERQADEKKVDAARGT